MENSSGLAASSQKVLHAASNAPTGITSASTRLLGWYCYNNGATISYLKLYNAAVGNVTVGTTTPKLTIAIPPGTAVGGTGYPAALWSERGIRFNVGLSLVAVKEFADSGTTAVGANEVSINLFWV